MRINTTLTPTSFDVTSAEYPCGGKCKRTLLGRLGDRPTLCPDCRETLFESLAAKLDATYDTKVCHNWHDCGGILRRYWCFNVCPPTASEPLGSLDMSGLKTLG